MNSKQSSHLLTVRYAYDGFLIGGKLRTEGMALRYTGMCTGDWGWGVPAAICTKFTNDH